MATKKISELSTAGALDGTEVIALVQSSATKQKDVQAVANTASSVSLDNTGLRVYDTGADHRLTIQPGEDLTADRTLDVVTGDQDVTVTLSGDVTLPAGTLLNGVGANGVQSLSGAGAINITQPITAWTTTSTDAGTLADGAEGQLKFITMVADGGDGTLTPSNFGGGSTITFNDVGDSVLLMFTGSNWYIIANNGCTVA